MQVVSFCVGEQTYALDIMRVKEIVNPVPIAAVPGAPAFVEGLIELRGALLPVIDLRKRLAVEPAPLDRDSKYMVVRFGDQRVALIVDRVIDVRRVDPAAIAPVPELVNTPGARLLAGVARWDGHVVLVVDLDRVLSLDEHAALDGMEP